MRHVFVFGINVDALGEEHVDKFGEALRGCHVERSG
jgi:hypothetical protein